MSVVVDRLEVRFGDQMAVDDLSLTAPAGAITALLGPNGAGKSTTVDVISGLRRPTRGSATILGHSPQDPVVKARMGVMLQSGGLYPTARPLEWLRYLSRLYRKPADPEALLELVGLDPRSKTTARRMSGGEQQRLRLAAALLPRPEVLVLDEPTAGLDAKARRGLLAELRERRDSGTTILLTTHVLADVEELADTVVVIARGRLLASGTLESLTGASDAITFAGPMHLPTQTLADALPLGYVVDEPEPGTYVVQGEPTPQVLATITAWCAQHQALATSMRVGRRTLEDLLIEAAEA